MQHCRFVRLRLAYAACAPEVRLAGGEYVETPPDGAIRDDNLVTGFAWPAHPEFLVLVSSKPSAHVFPSSSWVH
jgi:putative intracellular protease/amidase